MSFHPRAAVRTAVTHESLASIVQEGLESIRLQ